MNTILFKKLRDFCLYSDIKSLKKYIDDGVDINYIDSYSGSNLLKALLCGSNLEVAKLLLDNGININSIDNFGNTPLDIALKEKHTKAVKLLKSLGAKTSEYLECN